MKQFKSQPKKLHVLFIPQYTVYYEIFFFKLFTSIGIIIFENRQSLYWGVLKRN